LRFFYYKAADIAEAPKLLWTGLPVIVSLASRILPWGLLGLIFGQVVLFFVIAIVRAVISNKD